MFSHTHFYVNYYNSSINVLLFSLSLFNIFRLLSCFVVPSYPSVTLSAIYLLFFSNQYSVYFVTAQLTHVAVCLTCAACILCPFLPKTKNARLGTCTSACNLLRLRFYASISYNVMILYSRFKWTIHIVRFRSIY
jgi:hypothetical protein